MWDHHTDTIGWRYATSINLPRGIPRHSIPLRRKRSAQGNHHYQIKVFFIFEFLVTLLIYDWSCTWWENSILWRWKQTLRCQKKCSSFFSSSLHCVHMNWSGSTWWANSILRRWKQTLSRQKKCFIFFYDIRQRAPQKETWQTTTLWKTKIKWKIKYEWYIGQLLAAKQTLCRATATAAQMNVCPSHQHRKVKVCHV